MGGIGREMQSCSVSTHKDTYYNRTAGDAEFYRNTHARDIERNASENQTQDNTDKNREQVRVSQLFLLIAKHFRYIVDSIFLTYYSKLVTYLEPQFPRRQNVDTCAVYPRDIDSIGIAQMQVAEFGTVHVPFRHEHVSGYKSAVDVVPVNVFLVPVLLHCLTEKLLCNAGFPFFGHDQDMFSVLQYGVTVRYDHLSLFPGLLIRLAVELPYSGNHKMDGNVLHDVADALSVNGRVAHAEFRDICLVVMGVFLFASVFQEQCLEDDDADDDADDAERIAHCTGHCHFI